jgi:DNA ligase (NAD+)
MSKSDPEAEIEKLRAEIREHDQRYYVDAQPTIDDLAYDRLMERLKKLEADHPELATPDSPTQRVGDRPVEYLTQVRHLVPMMSIDNTYSLAELRKYGQRTAKLLAGEEIEWVVELKIDVAMASLGMTSRTMFARWLIFHCDLKARTFHPWWKYAAKSI